VIDETPSVLHFHEHVHVAVLGFFTPCCGPEDADIPSSVLMSQSQDVLAMDAKVRLHVTRKF
jgi:hypothetical protein